MADLICPGCKATLAQAGFTYRCAACHGAWIAEETLVGMLEERAATLVALPWAPRTDTKSRPCAECGEAMQTVDLGDVELDRCPSHGVYFDDRELTMVLGEAKQFVKPVEPREKHASLLDALKHIFKR